MSNSKTKKIVNLIEKIVDNKVDNLVEERVNSIVPMLVEHEVKRLIREQTTNGDDIDDSKSEINEDKKLASMLSGNNIIPDNVSTENGGTKTLSYTSNNVKTDKPLTDINGKNVDPNNPNVQHVVKALNRDYSDMINKANEHSKNKGPVNL